MLLKIEEEKEKREEVFIFFNDLKFVYNHLLYIHVFAKYY